MKTVPPFSTQSNRWDAEGYCKGQGRWVKHEGPATFLSDTRDHKNRVGIHCPICSAHMVPMRLGAFRNWLSGGRVRVPRHVNLDAWDEKERLP